MQKAIAEFIGTATLVLFGCGAAVLAGDKIGFMGIAFAFGLSIVAMAYGIGPVSGCHVNPAVSLGALVAGRMTTSDFITYVIAQVVGAVVGAGIVYLIATGKIAGYDVAKSGLGQNGWGPGYIGEYGMASAFLFEVVATFVFLVVILGVTQKGSPSTLAGLAIGLTLVMIHLVGIPIDGTSVNPARSLGPALFAGSGAMSQLWLFIVAPAIGAAAAGLLFRAGSPLDASA